MTRRIGAAILMCAVMVLVAAVPLALAETHTVLKGPQGPRASALTWSYSPTEYGLWYGHIENNGLRSLMVDVYDDTNNMATQIMHQRIRFAAYNANPVGTVDTASVIMAADRTYTITVTPNGPRGSTATVEDMFIPAIPPTAVIDAQMNFMMVTVDGSGSTDVAPGYIVSYAWEFGDGATATGMTASHEYATEGTYTIALTVTDNDGLTGSATQDVSAILPTAPPVASFTATPNKLVVSVDGSASSDPDGTIVSYSWDFGDGGVATGVTATHTYATWGTWWITLTVTDDDGLTGSMSTQVTVSNPSSPPPTPYTVIGYVYDSLGSVVFGASVTLTDVQTGTVWLTTTDFEYGYYEMNLNTNETGWVNGDTIVVTATFGSLTGSASGVTGAPGSEAFLFLDVILP